MLEYSIDEFLAWRKHACDLPAAATKKLRHCHYVFLIFFVGSLHHSLGQSLRKFHEVVTIDSAKLDRQRSLGRFNVQRFNVQSSDACVLESTLEHFCSCQSHVQSQVVSCDRHETLHVLARQLLASKQAPENLKEECGSCLVAA